MGAKSSSMVFPESRYYSILDYGYCKVWKRNDTHKETMEQYDVTIDSQQQLMKYQKMWQLRTQEQNIAGVYYFTHSTPEQFCGVFQKGSILTERIPYRLSQFCNIPYEEALTIITMALQTYKTLQLEYGLFQVRSTMVGLNFQNQIKVWLHTDFSSPEPENGNCASLYDMVDSIIQAIEINADTPEEYVKFSQFVRVNKEKIKPSFDEVLSALLIYKDMNCIPEYEGISRLQYYLRRAEGWQEASFNSNFLSNMAIHNKDSPERQLPLKQQSDKSFHSHKTTKNTRNAMNMNIYTHKEVNQLLQREKFLSRNLFSRENSQKSHISQPKQPVYNYSPFRSQRDNIIGSNNIYEPVRRESNNVRFVSKSPDTKIQFKIIPSQQRRSNTPINQLVHQPTLNSIKPSHSSIQNRIPPLPQRQSSPNNYHAVSQFQPTIYTRIVHQGPEDSQRRNRFDGNRENSSLHSQSRQSSLFEPARAET